MVVVVKYKSDGDASFNPERGAKFTRYINTLGNNEMDGQKMTDATVDQLPPTAPSGQDLFVEKHKSRRKTNAAVSATALSCRGLPSTRGSLVPKAWSEANSWITVKEVGFVGAAAKPQPPDFLSTQTLQYIVAMNRSHSFATLFLFAMLQMPRRRPSSCRRGLQTPRAPPLSEADFKEQYAFKPACNISLYGENLSRYRPGGYHPVSPGDTFKDDRYVATRKLGWGDSSTVWLVKDAFLDRWVALKIFIAELSTSRQPVAATKALCCRKDTAELVPALYDSFFHEGPNGVHLCLVMELLGPTLWNLMMYFIDICDRIHLEDVLRLTRQILSGVATFHGAGIARGDLNASNLVFTIRNLVDDDALFEALGEESLKMEIVRRDGAPLTAHMPRQFHDTPDWHSWVDEDEEDLRFVGVDDWFRTTDRMPSSDALRGACPAPEVLFEETYDYRADLWHAGCVIHELIFQNCPFMYMGNDQLYITEMIGFVEGLPPEWEPAWRCIRATSAPPPEHLLRHHSPTVSVEQSFKNKVPEAELTQLLPVIRGLLRFRPQDRISARQALALLL
ncbi:hypothetical protein MY4038_008851 [Beauveria bassiana]